MAKKKKADPQIGAVHGRMAKTGPIKHRLDRRRNQRQRRYDQEVDR